MQDIDKDDFPKIEDDYNLIHKNNSDQQKWLLQIRKFSAFFCLQSVLKLNDKLRQTN